MALDADAMGLAIYNVRQQFNNKDINEILMLYGSIDNARLEQCKNEAAAIINHIKTNGDLIVPGTGLTSPSGPVSGSSTTGKMQ